MDFSIFKEVENYETIIIQRHVRPDGDALGSQIGFREALRATYPKKKVLAIGDENEAFIFIGSMDIADDTDFSEALVFILDTPEESMISDSRYRIAKKIFKVDHIVPRVKFGDIQYTDPSYESLSGLITDMLFNLDMKLSVLAARALYTGIVTDSGRFRYDSVTSRTFELASKLMKYNFSLSEIYNNLYLDDLRLVKLRARFIMKFQLTKNNVAYIKTTKDELVEYDANIYTVSRGMVNTMGGISGIEIWTSFTEDPRNNTVIAEIRSSKYNIKKIAEKYGGGGQDNTSAATLSSFEEVDRMLDDLDELIIKEDK